MSTADEHPPFEQTHEAELKSAAKHLTASKELSQEAHEGWTHLPSINEADDAHHPGSQGQQAPAD